MNDFDVKVNFVKEIQKNDSEFSKRKAKKLENTEKKRISQSLKITK